MPLTLRLTKGTELTHQELDDNFTYLEGIATGSSGTDLSAFSVTTGTASGGGSLTYASGSGVFTFTPADLSSVGGGTDLSAFSVTTGTASGGGSLTYSSGSGEFSFTPADLSTKAALTDISVGANATASGSGALAYNSSNGVFTFTPPDLSSVGGGTDLSAFSVTTDTASGGGSLTYASGSGVFTFTPADLSGLGGGGIALTDLSTTTATASGGGSLSYNGDSGVFTFAPAQIPNIYGVVTASDSSLTGVLSPGSTNDYLYFKGGNNVTVTTTSTAGTGSLSGVTLDTVQFDVDLSGVSGGGSEVGRTYLRLNTAVQTSGESQSVLTWSAVDNNSTSASYEFGNTSNSDTEGVVAEGSVEYTSATFLRCDLTVVSSYSGSGTITYRIQTAPNGTTSWGDVAQFNQEFLTPSGVSGTLSDVRSFWRIFKIAPGVKVRVIASQGSGITYTIALGTQLEIVELN